MFYKYISNEFLGITKYFLRKFFNIKNDFSVSDHPLLDPISLNYFCKKLKNVLFI